MYKNTSKMKEFFISSIFSYVNLYAFVHSLCLLLVQLLKFGKVQTVDGFYYSLKCKKFSLDMASGGAAAFEINALIIPTSISYTWVYKRVLTSVSSASSSAICRLAVPIVIKKKSYTYNKYFELLLKKYVLCIFS